MSYRTTAELMASIGSASDEFIHILPNASWRVLSWQGRAVYALLKCNVNLIGETGVESCGAVETVHWLTDLPIDIVAVGLPDATRHGLIAIENGRIRVAGFVEEKERFKPRKPISKKLREEVIAEHGMNCWLCKRPIDSLKKLHLDHVLAVSNGGTNDLSNLRPAHVGCNSRKGRYPLSTFDSRAARAAKRGRA